MPVRNQINSPSSDDHDSSSPDFVVPTPCANNCGFFGSQSTLDLCSSCYTFNILRLQIRRSQSSTKSSPNPGVLLEQALSAAAASENDKEKEKSLSTSSSSSISSDLIFISPHTTTPTMSRCGNCRRRLGLTGFKCRCGTVFCRSHRYPEMHGCSFDYKAVGREGIARANPAVKGDKITDRI